MKEILQRIAQKKAKLDSLRPIPPELEKNLYEWFRVAFTYSSNAIEGNTLSMAETAEVIEKNLTVAGKTITEHLEAHSHAEAIDLVKTIGVVKKRNQINLDDILAIHKMVLQKINIDQAGRLRTVAVRVIGSPIPCPNYLKVPTLMDELVTSITTAHEALATIAAHAHLQLVYIHPFVDGNGRTARLLMNLLLLQEEYPPVSIDVKDRITYINAIQKALQGDSDDYYRFIYENIERSLDEYIKMVEESK